LSTEPVSKSQIEEPTSQTRPQDLSLSQAQVYQMIYPLALLGSICLWFIAVRAPLWLDETGSFWQIAKGFWQIPSRQGGLSFPAYSYILWFFTKILGTSEIALRVPSILAMLAAAYLLYRAARELFDQDVAIITTAVFCVHPVVVFAAIDVRPYAFAALAINAALFTLVRLRHDNSDWLAAAFGVAAAVIVWFHFLFAVILPVLLVCLLALALGLGKTSWRQVGIALAAFTVAILPVIPGLLYMFRTRGTHVFDTPPDLGELGWTLAPGWLLPTFLAAAFVAAATKHLDLQNRVGAWQVLVGPLLGLVPILILYGVSVKTPLHIFVYRHRLVAIPGIALCWGWSLSRIDSRVIRALFCVVVVASAAYLCFTSPFSKRHGYSWKWALEFAEKNASADHAPMLICSDFPEADYETMPVENAKESALLAPLSYYKVSGPVIALPRALNQEAVRVMSAFLRDPSNRQRRFLALAFGPSYPTLNWLVSQTSATYQARLLGDFDDVAVVEFTPRSSQGASP